MQLPLSLNFIRRTRLWQSARDLRYLRRQRPLRNFYRAFVARGDLVFDIGANIGNYALIFHSLGARVIAVEPQAALVGELRRRFCAHRTVQILHTALGPNSSTAVLHKTPGLTEIASLRVDIADRSRFSAEHKFSETETVPVTTLDHLIAAHGEPNFCKIDVEGFELAVLSGLTRPLPLLGLEFNREFLPETCQCIDRLGELGAYQFNYAVGSTPALASVEWLRPSEIVTALQTSPDPLLWGDLYARRIESCSA